MSKVYMYYTYPEDNGEYIFDIESYSCASNRKIDNLYAWTTNKKHRKEFKKTRNMNLLKELIVDSDEIEETSGKPILDILEEDYESLRLQETLVQKRAYDNNNVCCTDTKYMILSGVEYMMITEDQMIAIEDIMSKYGIIHTFNPTAYELPFKSKTMKALDTLGIGEISEVMCALYREDYDTSYLFNYFNDFNNMKTNEYFLLMSRYGQLFNMEELNESI